MKHKINVFLVIFSALICAFVAPNTSIRNEWLLYIGLCFFFVLSAGVLFMRMNYFVKSISRIQKPAILLTFDDGPHPENTPKILAVLKEHNCKALFFLIGSKAQQFPDLVEQIQREGHLIGNHTQHHSPFFAMMSRKKVKDEVLSGQQTLEQLCNKKINLFRPPVGITNPKIAYVINQLNLQSIGWNKRSFDTVFKTPQRLVRRLQFLAKPGSIILLHDNLNVTADALPVFMEKSAQKNLEFVNESTINSLFQ
jgi:peptidoglycan/xylan/chitin deacetylase (PgdA/CDA1 family)